MSARYYDAGSGPHDADSSVNERGERNCGCRHDGLQWLAMCATAQRALQELKAGLSSEHDLDWINN